MTMWIVLEQDTHLENMMLTMVDILGDAGVGFSDEAAAMAWIDAMELGHVAGDTPEVALLNMSTTFEDSGPAVAARLRQSAHLKNMVIILMAPERHRFEEQEAVVERSGANFVLYKPLPSPDELDYILHGLLLSR
jgi:hypothetical protein